MRCLFPKRRIFSLKIKGHLFPLDMLVGLLERQFLEEGRVTYCSTSVLWRDGGTAGRADWVFLSRTGAVGSEGEVERERSSEEAFSYGFPGPVSSLHLPYFCLSEVLTAHSGACG